MPAHKVWRFNSAVLEDRIWAPGGSARSVAGDYGCHHQTILLAQEEFDIPKRAEHWCLDGRWSHRHECCQEHGGTDVPHKAWGLCLNCYARLVDYPRVREKRRCRKQRAMYDRHYYREHKAKKDAQNKKVKR